MQALIDFFCIKGLLPHGYYLSWSPVLLWLHVIPDILITLACFSIPLMLIHFLRQKKGLPYPWLIAMFSGFIIAFGSTHLLSAITIWIPLYWLDGVLKGLTALLPVATAILMLWLMPQVLSLSSVKQLQEEIHHRKAAEDALCESENKLATILDSIGACIYVKDSNYQYQYSNQSVRQLFGKTSTEIIGKTDEDFFDQETAIKLRNQKQQLQKDQEHLAQLAQATRLGLLREMAAGIAHEVNQPLSAIATYAQVSLNLIKKKNPDLIKLAEVIVKTQQQALRAGHIVHRMKDLAKSTTKHHCSTADINALINKAVDLCSAELKLHRVKLTLELEKNLPPIYVDHIQIEQVLINLIRNGVEVLQNLVRDQQSQLTIQSYLNSDNAIQVKVKDNGLGLDEDQRKKIFMPFYTTKPEGIGMGLAISRSLIEAHEGKLGFNSEVGKGTSFYFTLPMEKRETASDLS